MPLLFERKKFWFFSITLVIVNVPPEADVNFCVASCSSVNIGLLRFAYEREEVPAEDLLFSANLIVRFLLIVPSAAESLVDSFLRRSASASRAAETSDFYTGALWLRGSKSLAEKLNLVAMPDKFFKTNFLVRGLLMRQSMKLSAFKG